MSLRANKARLHVDDVAVSFAGLAHFLNAVPRFVANSVLLQSKEGPTVVTRAACEATNPR